MFYLLHRDSSTGRATFCGNDGIPSGSVDGSLSKLAFASQLGAVIIHHIRSFSSGRPPKLFSPYIKYKYIPTLDILFFPDFFIFYYGTPTKDAEKSANYSTDDTPMEETPSAVVETYLHIATFSCN